MAAGYWSAIREHLPQAAVVFDRFHIIKLANEKLEDIRGGLQREAGILGQQYLKVGSYFILTAAENVPDERQEELAKALKFNEPLSVAYYLKEDLRALWDQTSAAKMRRHLKSWCKRAAESGIAQIVTLAKTLRTHTEGILNYLKHRISTGKLEGLNNKIKTPKRKVYGFRDQVILKLYSLHESKFSLSGT
jgi:transposase